MGAEASPTWLFHRPGLPSRDVPPIARRCRQVPSDARPLRIAKSVVLRAPLFQINEYRHDRGLRELQLLRQ